MLWLWLCSGISLGMVTVRNLLEKVMFRHSFSDVQVMVVVRNVYAWALA